MEESAKKSTIKILLNIFLFAVVFILAGVIKMPNISSYIMWIGVAFMVSIVVAILYFGVNGLMYSDDFKGILNYVKRKKG